MTLRTHLSADYSEASAARRQRACRHLELVRLQDEETKQWLDTYGCMDCEKVLKLDEVSHDRP
jgi:hypothetical protein